MTPFLDHQPTRDANGKPLPAVHRQALQLRAAQEHGSQAQGAGSLGRRAAPDRRHALLAIEARVSAAAGRLTASWRWKSESLRLRLNLTPAAWQAAAGQPEPR